MKKIILIVLVVFVSSTILAQYESRYVFNNAPPLLVECDVLGNKGALFAPESGTLFKITNVKNADTVIATFLYFGDSFDKNDSMTISDVTKYQRHNFNTIEAYKDTTNIEYKLVNGSSNLQMYNRVASSTSKPNRIRISKSYAEKCRKYFLISTEYLNRYAKPYYPTTAKNAAFIIGAQTLPFKIRIRNFDFAKQVTLGTSFGWQRRLTPVENNFLCFLGNVSISANDIDSTVTRKSIMSIDKNIVSFSLAAGVVYETRKIQLSVMGGWDIMSKFNQNKYDWIYNKKMWIGFGVGINVFSSSELTKASSTENQK